jgi:hypothetical protein
MVKGGFETHPTIQTGPDRFSGQNFEEMET